MVNFLACGKIGPATTTNMSILFKAIPEPVSLAQNIVKHRFNTIRRLHYLALISLTIALMQLGCAASHRHSVVSRTNNYRLVADTQPARNALSTLEFESRTPIQIGVGQPTSGLPLTVDEGLIRNLTLGECQNLAFNSSALGNALNQESTLVNSQNCGTGETPRCVSRITCLQAEHERVKSAGQATEAFLNLVDVYLQHEILLESMEEVDRASSVLNKLKENEIEVDVDPRELDRQENMLEEKAAELLYAQQQATTGLSLLLNLNVDNTTPIWTQYENLETDPIPELQSAVDVAFENRKDLAALNELACCCGPEVMELIRSSTQTLHPLIGLKFGPKRKWNFLVQKELEQEACCRCEQIVDVVRAKKKLIRLEISQLVQSMNRRARLIYLKKSTVESLRKSLDEAEKAVDIKPLDFKTQTENKAAWLQARSELIHEIVALEIDRSKLTAAQGFAK